MQKQLRHIKICVEYGSSGPCSLGTLHISVAAKGTLWVIFFGLAKTAQYSALLILGKAGIEGFRRRISAKNVKDICDSNK